MMVQAKCTWPCWDSKRCVWYNAGDVCEIDSESTLATLTHPAKKHAYIFQFDRVAAKAGRPETPQGEKG